MVGKFQPLWACVIALCSYADVRDANARGANPPDCQAWAEGVPSAISLGDALRLTRTATAHRGKYETDPEFASKVAGALTLGGLRLRGQIVSFPIDPGEVGFTQPTGYFQFRSARFGITDCTDLLVGSAGFDCPSDPISIATDAEKPLPGGYVGTNSFGVRARVRRTVEHKLGILQPTSSKTDWYVDVNEPLDRTQADGIIKAARWYVLFDFAPPFYAEGSDTSDPTLDNPVERRREIKALIGTIKCIALGVPGEKPIALVAP